MSAIRATAAPRPAARGPHAGPWLVPALVGLTLLIGTSGLLVYRSLRHDLRHETQRTLTVIAEQKRQQIEDWLAQTRRDADLFFSGSAQVPTLFGQWLAGERTDTALLERIRARLADLASGRNWDGLVLYDRTGLPVLVVGGAADATPNDAVPELLQRPSVGSPALQRNAGGERVYAVLAPVGPRGGAPLGAVALIWRAERSLFPLVASWPVPTDSAETYLVEWTGQAVRFLTPLRFAPAALEHPSLPPTLPLDRTDLPAARAVRGRLGLTDDGLDYRGVPVLAYTTVVAGTPWFLVAEIDRAEAEAGIRTTAWVTALIAGLGLLLVYATGYLLWREDRRRREAAANRAREAAESRFRVVFAEAPLGIALVDAGTGRIQEANARFGAILGRGPEELLSLDWMAVTHPDDLAQSQAQQARLAAGEAPDVHLTKRYLRPDGSVVWVNLRVVPVVVSPGGRPLHLSMIEDVTERHRMEEALRLSETRHRLIAEHSQDIIWTMDGDGRFTYLSPAVERVQGFTPEEAMRLPFEQTMTPESCVLATGALAQAQAELAAGRPVTPFRAELQARCKDGSWVWTETTGGGIYDAAGGFVGFGGVTREISERKRTERALKEARDAAQAASRAKSDFLAHMSHELRTPLNGVLGLAQVLAREPLTPGQREMVERIRDSGEALLVILNEVLDFSKIEAGALRLESAPFDLDGLLARLAALTDEIARAKGLRLTVEGPETAPGPLLGDQLRLEQVLQNLLGNAVKFTAHGWVRLRVRVSDPTETALRLRFEVEDSGIGIKPEALARLFAPFTQADSGITRRFGGAGLGLTIAKRLVEQMGGTIGAASEEGRGSRFWAEIPCTRAPGCAPGPGAQFPALQDGESSRDLLGRTRACEEARATAAGNGAEAVADPAALAGLRAQLEENNLKALHTTETLRPALGATLGEARAAALGRAVRALRFAEALALLEEPPADQGRSA